MKKIISFSIWGKKPIYTLSAFDNIKLAKKYYPDWTCRFYADETVPEETRKKLEKESEVILMPKSDGHYGAFWRFSPLDDESIDRFIVRDTDSRLNSREATAVQEWIDSGKSFHLMRDNVQHDPVPICAGMWGATKEFKPKFNKLLNNWLSKNEHRIFMHPRGKYFFNDQIFLADIIWPLIKNNHIAHVSYDSKWSGYKKSFPIKNPDGSFVGQTFEYE